MITDLAAIDQCDAAMLQRPHQLLHVVVIDGVDVRRDDQDGVAGCGLAPAVECAPKGEVLVGDGDDPATSRLGHLDGPVCGAGIDENQLVGGLRLGGQSVQKPTQMRLFIERADHR